VQGDRVGGQHELEKTAAQHRQRSADVAGIELARRETGKIALTLALYHRAEEFFLAGEMGVDGRLRNTGLARDRVHADRTKAARKKRPLCRGEDALCLAARRYPGVLDPLHRAWAS